MDTTDVTSDAETADGTDVTSNAETAESDAETTADYPAVFHVVSVLVLGGIASYATLVFSTWSPLEINPALAAIGMLFAVAIAYTYYYREEFD